MAILILTRSILTGIGSDHQAMGYGENSFPEKMIALIAPNGYKKKPRGNGNG
jgi:hypothetical protein